MKRIMWGSGQGKTNVLVGCALTNELSTLEKMAFNLSPIKHYIDIQVEDRSIRGNNHHGSLRKICEKLSLSVENLHNAGNDARYTLECLLRLAVLDSVQKVQYAASPTSIINWTDNAPTASTETDPSLPANYSSDFQHPEWLVQLNSSAVHGGVIDDLHNTASTVDNFNITNDNDTNDVFNAVDKLQILNNTGTNETNTRGITAKINDAIGMMVSTHAVDTIDMSDMSDTTNMTDITNTTNFTAATTATDAAKTTDTTNVTDNTRAAASNAIKLSKKKNNNHGLRKKAKRQAEAASYCTESATMGS